MEYNASDSFETRLQSIESRIAAAAERAGRDPGDVQLVAISKTFPPEVIDEALRAGVSILGESKVQEALAKASQCSSADWHLIGHLQSNKVRHALSLFSTIHSVDSIALLEDIERIQEEIGRRPRVLLQVNVSGEGSKTGFNPKAMRDAVRTALSLGNLDLVGLMTIPPWSPDPEQSRKYFRQLRELRDSLSAEFDVGLPELSMGMSADFEVAIEEGATFVRIGSAIFGKRSAWKTERTPDSDDYI